MPQLFIYAESEQGVEQTWLVDAYMTKGSGEIELYRNGVQEPIVVLKPEDVANHFIVLDWDEELSGHYNAEDFEFSFMENEDGELLMSLYPPTVH